MILPNRDFINKNSIVIVNLKYYIYAESERFIHQIE